MSAGSCTKSSCACPTSASIELRQVACGIQPYSVCSNFPPCFHYLRWLGSCPLYHVVIMCSCPLFEQTHFLCRDHPPMFHCIAQRNRFFCGQSGAEAPSQLLPIPSSLLPSPSSPSALFFSIVPTTQPLHSISSSLSALLPSWRRLFWSKNIGGFRLLVVESGSDCSISSF